MPWTPVRNKLTPFGVDQLSSQNQIMLCSKSYLTRSLRCRYAQTSVTFSTSFYTFKVETDCKFCNKVRECVLFVLVSDWSSEMTSHFSRTCCHTTHQLRSLKVNVTFKNWTEIWLLKVIYAISQTKTLKVCCQAGIGIYVIFACIVLRQTHVLFTAVYISDTVWNYSLVCYFRFWKTGNSIMQLVEFLVSFWQKKKKKKKN